MQQALLEYRLAQTVGLDERIAAKHLLRVESKISQRISSLNGEGKRAEARGREREAREHYLEILGLQPNHDGALEALRNLDKRRELRGLKNKQQQPDRAQYDAPKSQGRERSQDDRYADSRQAILDSARLHKEIAGVLRELELHQRKYPKDSELRQQLIEDSLVQAEQAYQARQWVDALYYLNLAEKASKGIDAYRESVWKARKHYARELYDQGVIIFRSEPESALTYWNYALKFDPDDDRSRLRIRSMTK